MMTSQPYAQPSGVRIASLTQLPPSPEIKGTLPPPLSPDLSSLDGDVLVSPVKLQRLRAVARYETFRPQALACSNSVSGNFSTNDATNNRQTLLRDRDTSSLGAVAGAQGVSIFRVTKPHAPLLVLSHISNASVKGGSISSLSFQPDTSQSSLFLAAARGGGVLVWDVSGHSLSPLYGRLGMESSSGLDLEITSLSWMSSDNRPILTATTAHTACLWDLRQGSAAGAFRPSLRFGMSSRKLLLAGSNGVPFFVQHACSDGSECAIMDAAGTVRLYDTRMTERTRASVVTAFSAFAHIGVGIEYFPTRGGDTTRWLTWGIDLPRADPVVKVWSSKEENTVVQPVNSDDYWNMNPVSNGRSPRTSGNILSKSFDTDYKLVGQCSTPHLVCARICPSPVVDNVVTIGVAPPTTNNPVGAWQAELWKINSTDHQEMPGLEKVVSFRGGQDESLSSMLGRGSSLGRLQAVELALTSSSHHGKSDGEKTKENERAILVCCLSENGIVTTHVIPEALPKQHAEGDQSSHARRSERRNSSPLRGRQLLLRNSVSNLQGRSAQEEKERHAFQEVEASRRVDTLATGGRGEPPSSPLKLSDPVVVGPTARGPGGGIMLFDMDVPVSFGSAAEIAGASLGVGDLATSNVVASSAIGVVEDTGQAQVDVVDANAIMDSIETGRVPCPRFCGATFGPGIGGLAVFHNGDVKKMWSWYQRADSIRQSDRTGVKNDPAVAVRSGSPSPLITHTPSMSTQTEKTSNQVVDRDFPRTLQDLIDMTSAAKQAQWGAGGNDSDASSAPDSGDSLEDFFEDESLDDGSNSSESVDAVGTKELVELNESSTSDLQSRGSRPSAEKEKTDGTESASPPPASHNKLKRAAIGPSSDMLAPLVRVQYDFDTFVLNNQNEEFAEQWQLGSWVFGDSKDKSKALAKKKTQPGEVSPPRTRTGQPVVYSPQRQDPFPYVQNPSLSPRGKRSAGLPNYRLLMPSTPSIPRVKSDPMLEFKAKGQHAPFDKVASRSSNLQVDEPGVHGGEYSVRPNMQESMVFLRKLFTHQQEGGTMFPHVMSPPDGRFVSGNLSMLRRPSSLNAMERPTAIANENVILDRQRAPSTHKVEPGVYALRQGAQKTGTSGEDLNEMNDICLFNAKVCDRLGDTEKRDVWRLLAQSVNSLKKEEADSSFYGSGARGALGVELVGNLLKYYESLGDVQMLSSIVCVLRGARRRDGVKVRHCLLPPGQDVKYDNYIRLYADLLYAWGLLTIRAELGKHLLLVPQIEGKEVSEGGINGTGRAPVAALVFKCPRCNQEVEHGSNICRNCRDFAFRCTICDNAVRGLFTLCDSCGHGGHVNHILKWFTTHKKCPSGCGCNCTFSSQNNPPSDLLPGPAIHEALPEGFGQRLEL